MKIIAVDDEPKALSSLLRVLREVEPVADVVSFTDSEAAFSHLASNKVDIAFLDIKMGGLTGLALAEKCKGLCPTVNIIFVTGYSQYTMDALRLHVSGYLIKPVRAEDLLTELENLRHPLPWKTARRVRIQTFGYFEVFVDGKPLTLPRRKCKECLAFLVDRRGARVTTRELAAILWEGREFERTSQNNTLKIISELMKALHTAGVPGLVMKSHGDLAINTDMVDCDYYRALDGDKTEREAFRGEYMSNYSWAEFTLGELSQWF